MLEHEAQPFVRIEPGAGSVVERQDVAGKEQRKEPAADVRTRCGAVCQALAQRAYGNGGARLQTLKTGRNRVGVVHRRVNADDERAIGMHGL